MPIRKPSKKTPKRRSRPSGPVFLSDLPTYSTEAGLVNVVIETPKGSPNKLDYNTELGVLQLKKVLPQGLVFPFDFGFIPSTIAEDGDPEDVLLLLEEPITAGVVVPARLVGVIEAVQQEKTGKSERNDRLIAVAPACQLYAHIETLSDLPKEVLDQVQHFFVTYNAEEGKQFIPQGQHGPKRALKCLEKSQRRYARKHKQK